MSGCAVAYPNPWAETRGAKPKIAVARRNNRRMVFTKGGDGGRYRMKDFGTFTARHRWWGHRRSQPPLQVMLLKVCQGTYKSPKTACLVGLWLLKPRRCQEKDQALSLSQHREHTRVARLCSAARRFRCRKHIALRLWQRPPIGHRRCRAAGACPRRVVRLRGEGRPVERQHAVQDAGAARRRLRRANGVGRSLQGQQGAERRARGEA